MQLLADSNAVRRCFAAHWYAYALSSLREERQYGQSYNGAYPESVEYLVSRAAAEPDYDLTELFVAVTETSEFLAP
jgi:hypothetical protein